MPLAVALSAEQIERSGRLHRQLPGWLHSEQALDSLAERFPGIDRPAVPLKVVTVNALYGTHVYAVMRMAEHVREVLSHCELATAGADLVEELARLPVSGSDGRTRRYHSFASKFAHFFVDSDRFPIKDSYATQMVKLHLGRERIADIVERPYVTFAANFAKLKELAAWDGSSRELDHYLWLAGQYRAWKRNPDVAIGAEAKRFFASPPPDLRADLDALLPSSLGKTFRGGR